MLRRVRRTCARARAAQQQEEPPGPAGLARHKSRSLGLLAGMEDAGSSNSCEGGAPPAPLAAEAQLGEALAAPGEPGASGVGVREDGGEEAQGPAAQHLEQPLETGMAPDAMFPPNESITTTSHFAAPPQQMQMPVEEAEPPKTTIADAMAFFREVRVCARLPAPEVRPRGRTPLLTTSSAAWRSPLPITHPTSHIPTLTRAGPPPVCGPAHRCGGVPQDHEGV